MRKAKVDKMILKLDISKAYDKLDRGFLLDVMERFGFRKEWTQWVKRCISNPRFSILINGSP